MIFIYLLMTFYWLAYLYGQQPLQTNLSKFYSNSPTLMARFIYVNIIASNLQVYVAGTNNECQPTPTDSAEPKARCALSESKTGRSLIAQPFSEPERRCSPDDILQVLVAEVVAFAQAERRSSSINCRRRHVVVVCHRALLHVFLVIHSSVATEAAAAAADRCTYHHKVSECLQYAPPDKLKVMSKAVFLTTNR